MNFEDIVDMDWLNSHTIDSSLPSPPMIEEEDEEMMLSHPTLLSSTSAVNNEYTMDYTTAATPTTNTTAMMNTAAAPVMPTTEQIKQLIELAKRQLALREQQQQQAALVIDTAAIIAAEPTPEPDSPPPTTNLIKLEELFSASTTTVSPESLIKTEFDQVAEQVAVPVQALPVSKFEVKVEEQTIRRDSFASISDEGPMSLEAYAETDGIDIKKLSSKERRQLRNKISARNFRVRRKEYITTLEGQVDNHKKSNEQLLSRLNSVEEENKQLKLQLDSLKRQNQSLLEASNLNNKDLSFLGSNPSDTYRQDTSILVEC